MLRVDAIAKSAPDGLTIGISGGGGLGVHIGQAVNRSYDPAKDLARISKAAETPFILVATPALKANSLGDLIKLAKAGPNKYFDRLRGQRHGDAFRRYLRIISTTVRWRAARPRPAP